MRLFLVRHAHAHPGDPDALRPLSERGRLEVARLNRLFTVIDSFRPAQLWHSPLVRARETALLLALALEPEPICVETDDLRPEDDPAAMAARLALYPDIHHVALVGHEPHLSALATLLVRGRATPNAFVLRKGAVLALERTAKTHGRTGQPRWLVRWLLDPSLLPPTQLHPLNPPPA